MDASLQAGGSVLTRDGTWIEDHWQLLEDDAPVPAGAGTGVVLVSTPRLVAHPELLQQGIAGAWVAPETDVSALRPLLPSLRAIAVRFPVYRDGRGYSSATILRAHFGFRGELRAVGDILVDQLFYLQRVGFDSFGLRPDQGKAACQAALRSFSDSYQASATQPLPLFRRRGGVRGIAA